MPSPSRSEHEQLTRNRNIFLQLLKGIVALTLLLGTGVVLRYFFSMLEASSNDTTPSLKENNEPKEVAPISENALELHQIQHATHLDTIFAREGFFNGTRGSVSALKKISSFRANEVNGRALRLSPDGQSVIANEYGLSIIDVSRPVHSVLKPKDHQLWERTSALALNADKTLAFLCVGDGSTIIVNIASLPQPSFLP